MEAHCGPGRRGGAGEGGGGDEKRGVEGGGGGVFRRRRNTTPGQTFPVTPLQATPAPGCLSRIQRSRIERELRTEKDTEVNTGAEVLKFWED